MRACIIFDGECSMCSTSVRFIIRNDPAERFSFTPRQSEPGRRLLERFGIPAQGTGSLCLVEGDTIHLRSTAVLRIARGLRFPWRAAYALVAVPRPLRDRAYDWVARNRHRWSRPAAHCPALSERERARFLTL